MKKFSVILLLCLVFPVVSYSQYKEDTKNDKYGLIDEKGNVVIPHNYSFIYYKYNTKLLPYVIVEKNDKQGIFNVETGKEVIPCKYESVSSGGVDFPYVTITNSGKKGLLNIETGKEVIPCKYESVNSGGVDLPYVTITNSGKKGLFNIETGKEVIPCKYEEVFSTENHANPSDRFYQISNNNKWGSFDIKTGKEVVPCRYEIAFKTNLDRYFRVSYEEDGNLGIFDWETGIEVVPVKYKRLEGEIIENKYLLFRDNNGRCGILDITTGKEVIPCKYDDIKNVSEDLVAVNIGYNFKNGVRTNGKWGYVDINTGEVVIPIEYDDAKPFDKGVARVTKDGQTTLIKNPLKEGNAIALAQSSSTKKDPNAPAISRYPAPNSDVDKDIPQSKTKNENLFAFIIANENYDENNNLSPVAFALNDGRIFKEYCLKTLGLPTNNVKMFEDASLGKIIAVVEQIKSIADVYDGEAEVIVFYAGHGYSDNTQNAYLLPVDGNASDIATTGYSLKKFYGELSKLKLKKITIFLDACYSGAGRDGEMLVSARGIAEKVKDEKPQGNMVVFSSATSDETAHPYEEMGHGLFTYFLLKKLQETQGNVTYGELSDYVNKQVKRQSVVINNKRQTPTVIPSESLTNWQGLKLK